MAGTIIINLVLQSWDLKKEIFRERESEREKRSPERDCDLRSHQEQSKSTNLIKYGRRVTGSQSIKWARKFEYPVCGL